MQHRACPARLINSQKHPILVKQKRNALQYCLLVTSYESAQCVTRITVEQPIVTPWDGSTYVSLRLNQYHRDRGLRGLALRKS